MKFMYFIKDYLVGFYKKIKGYLNFNLLHDLGSYLPSLTFMQLCYLWWASLFIYVGLLISYIYLILSVLHFFRNAFDTMIKYSNVFLTYGFLNDYVDGGVSSTQLQRDYLTLFFDILNSLGLFNAFSLVLNLFLQLYSTLFLCYILGTSLKLFWFICTGIFSYMQITLLTPNIFMKYTFNPKRIKKPDVKEFTSNNIDKLLP